MAINPLADITAVIVNYKTYALTRRSVESLRAFYPDLPLLLVDNGSDDASTAYIRRLAETDDHVRGRFHQDNLYHGPAMHDAIVAIESPYVFTLDSDCEIVKGGFLESMLTCFEMPDLYAVGRVDRMDRYGYVAGNRAKRTVCHVHPYAMLLDREKYRRMRPFEHHGSPCLANMKQAQEMGLTVQNHPLDDFIIHEGRGTCSRYGYGLGIRTSIEKMLHQLDLFT